MINNRLFKKINAIFWGILTFLPIFIATISVFAFEFNPQIDQQYPVSRYLMEFLDGINQMISNGSDYWYNPITSVLHEISIILDTVSSGSFYFTLIDIAGWACWVQVIRLLVYVFYWVIDLFSGLFDLMTFNRKGDN